ncbi:hypothetical protein POWCR01_000222000 [Plasmodium ovale]|uniref:PIR protein n=1 Tax=Plasmodium ovale TaxID=36330 RepID=A0A1C3KKI8_PLAOA|nr:hypothetical protein POWCR01_000222000 [Plasmodium ovale]
MEKNTDERKLPPYIFYEMLNDKKKLSEWQHLETEHYKSLDKFAQDSESVWTSLEREIPNTCQRNGLFYSNQEIKIRKLLYDLC